MTNTKTRYFCLHLLCLFLAPSSWLFGDEFRLPAGWLDNYQAARDAAQAAHKPLLVWFRAPDQSDISARFQSEVLDHDDIARRVAAEFVAVTLTIDTKSLSEADERRLIDHAAFAELRGQPGLAIVDFASPAVPTYGCVVSIYPLAQRSITAARFAALLDLPPGTLTQRTLIFAIRTHEDHPASATGQMHPILAAEAAAHARHQASINFQGHHNWGVRFASINARLPAGHVSYEVCAESWPGQSLVDAAEECVDSWRQSSGHWAQVSRQAEYYGYDMQRGAGGVWYATGIFGRRR